MAPREWARRHRLLEAVPRPPRPPGRGAPSRARVGRPGAGVEEDEGEATGGPLDPKIRQMLRELGRALADSSDVNRTLRRLHEEGYGLFMFLERREDGAGVGGGGVEAGERTTVPVTGDGEPIFRIHGGDLSFLRSIGIDPTRRIRKRKNGSP